MQHFGRSGICIKVWHFWKAPLVKKLQGEYLKYRLFQSNGAHTFRSVELSFPVFPKIPQWVQTAFTATAVTEYFRIDLTVEGKMFNRCYSSISFVKYPSNIHISVVL